MSATDFNSCWRNTPRMGACSAGDVDLGGANQFVRCINSRCVSLQRNASRGDGWWKRSVLRVIHVLRQVRCRCSSREPGSRRRLAHVAVAIIVAWPLPPSTPTDKHQRRLASLAPPADCRWVVTQHEFHSSSSSSSSSSVTRTYTRDLLWSQRQANERSIRDSPTRAATCRETASSSRRRRKTQTRINGCCKTILCKS